MLIALYFVIINVLLPQLAVYGHGFFAEVMTYVIMIGGLLMALGAIGIRVSNNLGTTLIGGALRAIGYIFRNLFEGLGWLIRNTLREIPQVYAESKRTFTQMGISSPMSSILSGLVIIILIIIII